MKTLIIVSTAVLLASGGQAATGAQTTRAPSTPQECVKAGRDFAAARQKEAKPITADVIRGIEAQRVEMVRNCGAQFDVSKASAATLAGLVELYGDSQQPELADQAVTRGLAIDATPRERADLLAAAVRMLLRQPKSDARNARAEGYMDALDALPGDDTFEQKITAHSALNGYYRADDIDAGIVKHSSWLIDNRARLTPEQRKKFGGALTAAYGNLAEAVAGHGEHERAIELLKRAPADLPEVPNVESRLADTLARYLLVGTAPKPIEADTWLNRDAAAGPLDLTGKVSIVQFTAHWCGPCKESYPGIQRLRQQFKDAPFQVVFYTRTYGYFESQRNLTRAEEIERDREYFKGHGFDIPIAIGVPSATIVDGKPVYQEDPVEQAFGVGGIPQINILDRKGRIRLIMVGYDDANEQRIADFIRTLLKES